MPSRARSFTTKSPSRSSPTLPATLTFCPRRRRHAAVLAAHPPALKRYRSTSLNSPAAGRERMGLAKMSAIRIPRQITSMADGAFLLTLWPSPQSSRPRAHRSFPSPERRELECRALQRAAREHRDNRCTDRPPGQPLPLPSPPSDCLLPQRLILWFSAPTGKQFPSRTAPKCEHQLLRPRCPRG